MNLTTSNLENIKSTLSSTNSPSVSNVISGIKDPIGVALSSSLSTIDKLTVNINDKIDKLQQDIVKAADNTGKVSLVNNVLVVIVSPENTAKIPQYQAQIQSKIDNLNSIVHKLRVVTNSLKVIKNTAVTLKTALDVQEVLLTVGNPVAKATVILLKKAIKILFYKDVLDEYSNILVNKVSSTEQSIQSILSKLSSLSVRFEASGTKGLVNTTTVDGENNQLLSKNSSSSPEEFVDLGGRSFILNVESFGEKGLIGRAKDKYSSLLVTETSPSFTSTLEQLIEELKIILNNKN